MVLVSALATGVQPLMADERVEGAVPVAFADTVRAVKVNTSDSVLSEDDSIAQTASSVLSFGLVEVPAQPVVVDSSLFGNRLKAKGQKPSIYELPYSVRGRSYDWKGLWINTGVLAGAFVGTLFVLECLPEDATSWNRAALQSVPLFKRWRQHVLEKGPEWDHDKIVFNYVLHPYAGAAYFMGARSCGFNFYRSLLYSALVSTVGWEFGIEAFMERPSYQDLFVTPLVGSLIGEGFYHVKRYLVENDYRLLGSRVLGHVVAFLVDPLNEFVGYFGRNPARDYSRKLSYGRRNDVSIALSPGPKGFALTVTF